MLGKKRTELVEAHKGYSRKDGMWGTDGSWRFALLALIALLCFALLSFPLLSFPSLFFSTPALLANRLVRKEYEKCLHVNLHESKYLMKGKPTLH